MSKLKEHYRKHSIKYWGGAVLFVFIVYLLLTTRILS